MLDRTPAQSAVRTYLDREFQTNVLAQDAIWQAVRIALDAIEEDLAEANPDRWVVLDRLTPVHVADSPEQARAWIKARRDQIRKSTAMRFRYVKVAGDR
jgi:hypothetical protein